MVQTLSPLFLNHLTGSITVLAFALIVKSILGKENKLVSESYPKVYLSLEPFADYIKLINSELS